MNPDLQNAVEIIQNPILKILIICLCVAVAGLTTAVVYLFHKYVDLVSEGNDTLKDLVIGLENIGKNQDIAASKLEYLLNKNLSQ